MASSWLQIEYFILQQGTNKVQCAFTVIACIINLHAMSFLGCIPFSVQFSVLKNKRRASDRKRADDQQDDKYDNAHPCSV